MRYYSKFFGALLPLVFFSSLLLPSIASANGSFDAISSSLSSSWTHTVSGTSPVLVCFLDFNSSSGAPSVSFDSESMTNFDSETIGSGGGHIQYGFYLTPAPVGTFTVSVSGGGTFRQGVCESADGLLNVDTTGGTGNTGSPISNSITTTVANDFVIVGLSNNATNFTLPVNYTQRVSSYGGGGYVQDIGDGLATTTGSFTQGATAAAGGVVVGMSQIAFEPYSPPPSPTASTSPFDEIFGVATSSATASQTISIVDNPTQDFFNGVILFFGSAFLVMFWFKKRT